MVDVTAGMVKKLRDEIGSGMMDCKMALHESGGDKERAIDWLRAKGLAKAAKKSGRVAKEGLIGVSVEDTIGVMVEVNSETDFVARNEKFQSLSHKLSVLALQCDGDVTQLANMIFPGSQLTVSEYIQSMVGSIGENIMLRRMSRVTVCTGVVMSYVHNSIAPGLGRMGVLIGLESTGDSCELAHLGEQIAMHVAASAPLSTSIDDLDPAIIDRERSIYLEQAQSSGKPAEIITKMVEGRIRKFCEDSVLLSQIFVIDGERTVETVIKEAEIRIGSPIKIVAFVRMALGEGLENQETDFVAEVAAIASGS